MASFSLEFGASSQNQGAGSILPVPFFAHYPPEAGCLGLTATDGALTIQAKVTTLARQLLARSITDGTSFRIAEFGVGTGGYDTSFPIASIIVDPNATALSAEVFRDVVDLVETPMLNGIAKAFVCKISRTELKAGIGEIALYAEIVNSPYEPEIGTKIVFAIVHQPLSGKTYNHVQTYRIVLVL